MNDLKITLYTVTRQGVYRHEILGVYDELDKAKLGAYSAIKDPECDGYHSYLVGEIGINTTVKDVKPLYEYSKGKLGYSSFGPIIYRDKDGEIYYREHTQNGDPKNWMVLGHE